LKKTIRMRSNGCLGGTRESLLGTKSCNRHRATPIESAYRPSYQSGQDRVSEEYMRDASVHIVITNNRCGARLYRSRSTSDALRQLLDRICCVEETKTVYPVSEGM
jgi:hypothetical protein